MLSRLPLSCSSLLPISSTYSYKTFMDFYRLLAFLSSLSSLFLMFSRQPFTTHGYGLTTNTSCIDHSMIYVAIAGSYTPVVLALMNNFGLAIWLLPFSETTIFGIIRSLFCKKVQWNSALFLYLIMGWLVLANSCHSVKPRNLWVSW